MTVSLEKIFFNYILKNKKYFEIVKSYFFKNNEIQFVYEILRKYMLANTEADSPKPKQILEMVNLEDKDGVITKEILKNILTVDLNEFDEKNFIQPKFKAWILTNRVKAGTVDIIEETRNFDNSFEFDKVIDTTNKIKSIVDDISSTSFDDSDDIGSDFDEPEHHVQDTSRFKVKSGFETIDHMLGGGWDVATLNVIMAETNQGKCCHNVTHVNIRDKTTHKVSTIKLGTFFHNLSVEYKHLTNKSL